MAELYETVNHRRVRCGRCRHEVNQSRVTDGLFDSDTGLTYSCLDCHAIYAVCRRCGWYMEDGKTCVSCTDNPEPLLAPDRRPVMLPKHMKERNLVPDPGGRPGHWHHPETDEVVKMPIGWRPSGTPVVPIDDDPDAPEDLTGRKVMILIGRFEGKIGAITESGVGDDRQGLTVLLAESGDELPFETFDPYLRFLTDEEIAEADKAASEAKGQSSGEDAELKALMAKTLPQLRELGKEVGATFEATDTKPVIAQAILAVRRGS